MNIEELKNKFEMIEDSLGLCEHEIEDTRVWDYMRLGTFQQIACAMKVVSETHRASVNKDIKLEKYQPKSKSLSARLKRKIGKLKRKIGWLKPLFQRITTHSIFIGKCDFLFIGSSSSRRKLFNNDTFLELWCDPLIDYLGRKRCILVENFNFMRESKLIHTKRLFPFEIFKAAPCGLDASYVCTAKVDAEVDSFVKNINREIEAEFKVSNIVSNKLIHSVLRRKKTDLLLIKKRLMYMRPKAVFVVCSYGKELYIEASRKLSIPVIELQHGILSSFHLGYNYSGTATKSNFPDFFLTYGKYWETCVNLPISDDSIQVLGYPYMEVVKKTLLKKNNKKKLITFISQDKIGEEIADFACKFSKLVGKDWEVAYKLHPGEIEWRERYKSLAQANIRIIEGDSPSLYELLNETTLLVGVSSTAIYEGLAFGCHTYLLNLFSVEYMRHLINDGICTLVNDPEEISLPECGSLTTFDKNYFFDRNWKSNLDSALSKWLR